MDDPDGNIAEYYSEGEAEVYDRLRDMCKKKGDIVIIDREECGCQVIQDHDAQVHIEYCPLHKSAEDLLEACKSYMSLHDTINELMKYPNDGQILGELDGKSDALGALAEQALAKARGEL